MSFRINRGIFQFKDNASDTFINKFKIDDRGEMIEVDPDGNKVAAYMRLGDKATDSDLLDGVDSSNFIRTTNNSTLNSDTRNTRGVTRLYRNDSDSNYSVQHYWTGAHWFLRGYSGDSFHAEVRVGKADSADNATNASYLTGGDTSFRGLLYHSLNGDLNQYNVAGLYSAEYVGGTNIPLDQRGHFIQISDAGGTDVKTQWYYQSNGEKIHMRLMWGNQNWKEWRELITDSNIGSQSVDYAASAGNADTVDGYHATNAGGGIPVLNSNGYWDAPSWINVRGTGLYSSTTNGAHFVPNTHSYGSWNITGTRNGWVGLHFGAGSGVTLMMNETETGIHREGTGWKYRHTGGKFYVHTGTNGGGTGYPVWHEGNLTPISYATGSFFVGGDPETYYPVLLNKSSRTTGRFVIYRDNVHQDENNRGAGRLVLNGYTSGWGHVPLTLHYETKRSGGILWKFLASNYRTGLMVVYLKGATTYYYKSEHGFTLYDANGQGDAKSDGRTTWLPTPQDESNAAFEGETPSVLEIEHGVSYYDGYVKATGFKGDGANLTNVDAQTLDGIDSSGFLRNTAKAADSELLDGINSTSFLRSDVADTAYGNITLKYNTDNTDGYEAIMFAPYNDAAGLNDYIIKASSSRGVFGRKSFGWHVHSSSAFGIYSNGWEKLFGVEGETGNSFAKGDFTANNISTNQVFMQSITSDGTIANDKGSYLHLGGWAVSRTHASAVLVNTAYRADYATSLFDMNISRFTNDSGYVGQGSVDALAEELRPQIEAAQSTADGKLGATAKAADSNLLDGIDSSAFIRENQDRRHKVIRFTGESGDSGNPVINYGIYQEGGAWTHPYPDLVIGMHTGIKIGGYYGYNGTRFYNDAPGRSGASEIFSVGNGDSNVRVTNNLHIGSAGGWITDLLAAKANVSHNHNDLYYTKAQSNANYDAAGSASTAESNAIAAAGDRIDNEVMPIVTDNSTNISRNATEIAGKAAAGGSYGQDFAADDMYVDQWFRNTASGKGLYNEATTQHFYSDSDDYWNVAGGSNANGIRFRDEHAGTIRGYVYATNSNEVGFLDSDGNWAVRVVRDSHVEFRDNNEVTFTVGQGGHSSNYGTVCTHGTGRGNWEGYSINGWWVWMSSDGSNSGIYNDLDNEWMTRWHRNGGTELMHNGSTKLTTTGSGVTVTGTVSATAFSGNGSGLTNLTIPDQRVPVTINGEVNTKLASINMNLDRGLVEFTLDNGETFTAQMGR